MTAKQRMGIKMMKINCIVLAAVLLGAPMAHGQFAVDVTPQAQRDINAANDKKEAEIRRIAEDRAEAALQRAARLRQEAAQAEAARETARIQAAGKVEAARQRRPDAINIWVGKWRR